VGDTLLYTIELNNDAPAQDVTATVVDIVPENTSFITGSQGVLYDDGQLTWTGPVTADDAVDVWFTVAVTDKVDEYPTDIINTATVADGLSSQLVVGPVTTSVQSKVAVTKTVDLATAYAGSTLVYTIDVVPTAGSWAEVSDPIPGNTTFAAVSSPAVYEDDQIRFDAPPGTETTVILTVTVDSPLETPATIVNTAYITDDTDTMFTVDATTEITSPLSAAKFSVPGTAEAGAVASWWFRVENLSGLTTTATLTDVLPAAVDWITMTDVVTTTGSAGYASGVFTWTGDVGGEAVEWVVFPVTVHLGLDNGTLITNEAQIDDGAGTMLIASAVMTVSSEVDLASSGKGASDLSPVPNETITYTINVSNTGNMDAVGIMVTDAVPADMSYVEGSASDGGTSDGTMLTWSGVAVAAGESEDLTFQATVNDGVAAGTEISNIAWISQSTLSDPVTTAPVVITVGEQVVLEASKAVEPAVVAVGGRLTYTIAVTNAGNITTTEISITDPIPDDTTYVPGSVSANATYVETPGSQWIELTGETLGPGESLTVTFAVTVDVATTITNTAYIGMDGEEDTATVVASPVARIVVVPSDATLNPGGTQQFEAVGYDASDEEIEITPSWSVADPSAGVIDASGVFTAGTTSGYYPAAVVASVGIVEGTADVTVAWLLLMPAIPNGYVP
jgi:uncharacterized repeat protein (TIGR01451 family)